MQISINKIELIDIPQYDALQDEVKLLADSINENGLFYPIGVRESNGHYIVAVGRKRYLACKQLNLESIECAVLDVDDEQAKVLHIHENLKRTNLLWHEIADLTLQLHTMKQKELGLPSGGRGQEKKGWGMRDTAEELGKALSMVSENIMLANAVMNDPTLRNVKDRNTAVMMVRQKVKQIEMQTDAGAEVSFEINKVYCGSSEQILKSFPDRCFNACITDPPWLEFRDKKLVKDEMTESVFKEVYRVLSFKSFLLLFCGIDDFIVYRDLLPTLGFTVQQYPAIWCKPNTITMGTRKWEFARDFEMILLAIKGSPVLSELAMHSGFFIETPVHPSKLIHSNEKPVSLIKKLIECCSHPEALILDPFGGSGVTAEACFQTGRRYIVIERDPEAHSKILERMK